MARRRSSIFRGLSIGFRIVVSTIGFLGIPAGIHRMTDAKQPYIEMQQMWGMLSAALCVTIGLTSLVMAIGLLFRQKWSTWITFFSDIAILVFFAANLFGANFLPALLYGILFLLDALYMGKFELNLGKNPCAE